LAFQIFVLKQSWQRLPGNPDPVFEKTPFEKYVYENAGVFPRLKTCEYVYSGEQPVTTFQFIRKDLKGTTLRHPKLSAEKTSGSQGVKRTVYGEIVLKSFFQEEGFVFERHTAGQDEVFLFSDINTEPLSRTHVRILMTTRGWPLKHFRNLKDFLEITRDSVTGMSIF
jgi:hypothetical protein